MDSLTGTAESDQFADVRNFDHYHVVSTRRTFGYALLTAFIGGLTGCDPGIHVAWERDFHGTVDFDCIEKALRVVAPEVERTTYQSDGNGPRGFARGVTVTQFNYSDTSLLGSYTLDVAVQPDGLTHYWHEWGKIGTKVPVEEQRKVVPLLVRANRSVEQRCGLSFTGTAPRIGDG